LELAELIASSMASLARDRPVFNSEFDFQFALAWQIARAHPAAQIRLEKGMPLGSSVIKLDILVKLGRSLYAIELKYPKAKLRVEVEGELFVLPSAPGDITRYDFVRDVHRVEHLVDAGVVHAGCALMLTNLPDFWTPPSGPAKEKYWDAFRVHEGLELTGARSWSASAALGSIHGREASIELARSHLVAWHDYSDVSNIPGRLGQGKFRWLALPVARAQ
jgi:hypothetical protein